MNQIFNQDWTVEDKSLKQCNKLNLYSKFS